MLKIKNLSALIDNQLILNNYNIDINEGEIHAIMGPNGSGKSTLSKVIMGDSNYKITKGDITFNNQNIMALETDARARLGIFLAMQNPIEIDGITNADFLRSALTSKSKETFNLLQFIKEVESATNDLQMPRTMIHRSLNKGFSGGERKKNEILQMKILKPNFIILDEIDSGLDVDSLRIIASNIKEYQKMNPKISILIITHYPRILEYLKPDYVHVMLKGQIVKTGDASLANIVEQTGYDIYKDLIKE